jgi:hypothetical protein
MSEHWQSGKPGCAFPKRDESSVCMTEAFLATRSGTTTSSSATVYGSDDEYTSGASSTGSTTGVGNLASSLSSPPGRTVPSPSCRFEGRRASNQRIPDQVITIVQLMIEARRSMNDIRRKPTHRLPPGYSIAFGGTADDGRIVPRVAVTLVSLSF